MVLVGTGRDHFFTASEGGAARISLCGLVAGVSADERNGCCAGRDQTLRVGRGQGESDEGSGSCVEELAGARGVHLSRYAIVSEALGCKVWVMISVKYHVRHTFILGAAAVAADRIVN